MLLVTQDGVRAGRGVGTEAMSFITLSIIVMLCVKLLKLDQAVGRLIHNTVGTGWRGDGTRCISRLVVLCCYSAHFHCWKGTGGREGKRKR